MAKKAIVVRFERVVLRSQQAGTNDQHMVSRLVFNITVDGNPLGTYYADVKQTAGAAMALEAITVGPPLGYIGPPIPQNEFRREAATYFLELVGPNGSAHQFSSASDVAASNVVVVGRKAVTFQSIV